MNCLHIVLFIAITSLSVASTSVHAQPDSSSPDDTESHRVVLGSEANTLRIVMKNPFGYEMSEIDYRVVDQPKWVEVAGAEIPSAVPGESEATFILSFSVDDQASVGDNDSLELAFTSAGKDIAHTSFSLVVAAPEEFTVGSSYPNPFSDSATLPLLLPETMKVRVVLYDTLGREVLVVTDSELKAGSHQLRLRGSELASGIYLLQAISKDGAHLARRKITVLH